MFLTQSGGFITGNVAKLLGYIIEVIFEGLNAIGIANIGICIILFTFIIKLLMLPLTIKQQKSMKINSVMQPEIAKIQKKYKNKKDQDSMLKQNEEIQAIYKKYGTSMTGGCLPLLIQMPIIFSLYKVIYNIPAYISSIKGLYEQIVNQLTGVNGYVEKLNEIAVSIPAPTLAENPSMNKVIDLLSQFKTDTWQTLINTFSENNAVVDVISTNSDKLIDMNNFMLGINISESPGFRFSIYLIIPIAAALFQWLSTKTMNPQSQQDMGDNPAAGMMKSMTTFMPIMSFVMCMTLPAGIGLYWGVGSLATIVSQLAVNHHMNKIDVEQLVEQAKAKASKKKGKKSWMQKMMDVQRQSNGSGNSTGTISNMATTNTKKIVANLDKDIPEDSDDVPSQTTSIGMKRNSNRGSIASKANLVAQYNEKSKK